MGLLIRHGEEVRDAIKQASPKSKWLFAIAIAIVVLLLYFFVGLPGKPYMK